MKKRRLRKLRTFTIGDNIYLDYIDYCKQRKKVASREVEKFMGSVLRRIR